MEATILAIALLIFVAHFFAALFTKTRIPEVLPLMLLGILLGPVLGIIKPQDFGAVDKVFTQILLIIILFESGLHIRISQMLDAWGPAMLLNVVAFAATAAALTGLGMLLLGLPLPYALILGCVLSDNSFAIIIPQISKLNISPNLRTILLVECTFNSIFSIGCSVTLLAMLQAGRFSAGALVGRLVYTFLMSCAAGAVAAFFWTSVLNKIRKLENDIFMTFAFVMVVYFVCEAAGADGAIGAFIFGVIAGNIRAVKHITGLTMGHLKVAGEGSKAFNDTEKNFFGEVIFVLRTFFFVYIGICMQISNPYYMLCGFLLTMVIFLVRVPVANYTLPKSIDRLDASVAGAMVPKGLVTAVLASMIAQSGLPGGQVLQDIAYSVILFSILFSIFLSFVIENGFLGGLWAFLYKRHEPHAPVVK